jgi:hypothetical protein
MKTNWKAFSWYLVDFKEIQTNDGQNGYFDILLFYVSLDVYLEVTLGHNIRNSNTNIVAFQTHIGVGSFLISSKRQVKGIHLIFITFSDRLPIKYTNRPMWTE